MRLIFNFKNSHLNDDFIKENITTKVIDYSAKKNNQKSKHELSVYTKISKINKNRQPRNVGMFVSKKTRQNAIPNVSGEFIYTWCIYQF